METLKNSDNQNTKSTAKRLMRSAWATKMKIPTWATAKRVQELYLHPMFFHYVYCSPNSRINVSTDLSCSQAPNTRPDKRANDSLGSCLKIAHWWHQTTVKCTFNTNTSQEQERQILSVRAVAPDGRSPHDRAANVKAGTPTQHCPGSQHVDQPLSTSTAWTDFFQLPPAPLPPSCPLQRHARKAQKKSSEDHHQRLILSYFRFWEPWKLWNGSNNFIWPWQPS